MVIDDLSTPQKNKINKSIEDIDFVSAPISDRLMAAFIDIILHLPLISLVVSSLVYKLQILNWVTESESETFYVTLHIVFVSVLSVLILQSIYFKLLNYTPGMYFLKIRVRSFGSESLTWGQCFLRSFFWVLGLGLLGIPFVEVFSHAKKRLLHDRVSETEVVSLKQNSINDKPLALETSMVRLFLVAMGFGLLTWVFAFFQWTMGQIESGKAALSEFTERGFLCEDVEQYASRSQGSIESSEDRLDFAMSLFVLGQLDKECLELETNFVFLKKFNNQNKYWARVLLTAPQSAERTEYLTKACEENKIWCVGELLLTDSRLTQKITVQERVQKLLEVKWVDSPLSYKASLLIFMNRVGNNEIVNNLISLLQERGVQATGLIEEQVLVYQRENKTSEVDALFKGVRSVVADKDITRLYAQVCLQELNTQCQKVNDYCNTFNSYYSKNKDLASEPSVGRTLVKNQFCNPEKDLDGVYLSILDYQDLERLFLIQQSLKRGGNDKQSALAQLRSLIVDESVNSELRWDALQSLLLTSSYSEDWTLAQKFFLDWNPFSKSYLPAAQWLYGFAKSKNKESLALIIEKMIVPGKPLNPISPLNSTQRHPASGLIKGE